MMQLEPTGERMVEEHYTGSLADHVIHLMHIATYDFAEEFCAGRRVLDYGCGSGYGSARIARIAQQVQAVDVAEDAVAYAREKYPADNLQFSAIDPGKPLPFGDDSFDTVLSFQVFEHVAETDLYLREVRRVLRPGGTFVLVTPDRTHRLLPLQKPWNRWHLHEYSPAGLARMVRRHFDEVEMLGMGGKREMLDVELQRYRTVRLAALPVTLPIWPDRVRVAGLNAIHRLRGNRTGAPVECPYTVDDVEISETASPSVNIVAVLR